MDMHKLHGSSAASDLISVYLDADLPYSLEHVDNRSHRYTMLMLTVHMGATLLYILHITAFGAVRFSYRIHIVSIS